MSDITTILLITIGALIMFLAIVGTRAVLRQLQDSHYARYWRILQFMMGFFFAGYLAAIVMVIAGLRDWILFLTGVVFLFSALFVYFVVRLGNSTISELVKIKEIAKEANQKLQTMQENLASLIETRTAQLQASTDVGRAVVSILDTNQLLREIVNLITNRFGFYYTAVFLADPTGKWAVLREASGEAGRVLKERGHRLEVGSQSMVGMAMKTLKPRVALDVGDEAVRFANPLLPDTRSEITLPLVVGSQVMGALDVQSTARAAFDETFASVLQAMADQIAIALSNTIQFQKTQTALQNARQLNEASLAVTQAGDASSLLEALVTHAMAGADRAAILLYGPEDAFGNLSYIEVEAGWTRQADDVSLMAGTRYETDQLPLIQAIKPGEPFIINDVADTYLETTYREAMLAWNAQALLSLALTAGAEPVGALLFAFRRPRQFAASEIQSIQTLAQQAAVVLRNRQLVVESQTALQQLDEINRRLTGEAWEGYVEAAGQAVHIEKLGRGLSREAAQGPWSAAVTAPVVVNGVEIGALRLEDLAPDRTWTPTEVSVLQAIAGEVSIAIEKARLIEETEKRARRERTINRITRRIRNAPSVEQMLAIAAQELRSETQAARSIAEIAPAAELRQALSPAYAHTPAGTPSDQKKDVL